MGGIEIYAMTVVFILGCVGLIRGASKELGVTMALVVLLAVFAQFEALVGPDQLPGKLNTILSGFGLGSNDVTRQRMVAWVFYCAAMLVTTFMAYHGQDTLAFRWQSPSGLPGMALGWLAGALNGYLIAGTLWYYMRVLDYPMQRYSWFTAQFTDTAENMVNFLPQNIASGLVMGALALILLWWRILR
ncbi:MAG: hypothetical protein PVF45_00525 [Anaerolineae bacterium]|jgi:hypothetical protein